MNSLSGVLQRFFRETRGSEITEAAFVLPLMFMILLGIFWFGQAYSMYGAITRAAQDGARAGAAIPLCATCTTATILPGQYGANAVTAIQNSLTASNLDYTKALPPSPPPSLPNCPGSSPPSCTSFSGNFCIQLAVQLAATASGGTGDCGVSVSFQYPFTFWLPFTSINNQQIWLQAEARVHMEGR